MPDILSARFVPAQKPHDIAKQLLELDFNRPETVMIGEGNPAENFPRNLLESAAKGAKEIHDALKCVSLGSSLSPKQKYYLGSLGEAVSHMLATAEEGLAEDRKGVLAHDLAEGDVDMTHYRPTTLEDIKDGEHKVKVLKEQAAPLTRALLDGLGLRPDAPFRG